MLSEARIEVWKAMAEQFLDTESRQCIPSVALVCAEAGLSTEQARQIWDDEVAPALAFNLLCVAGEWAAWDPEWLVAHIERRRRPSAWSKFWSRFRPRLLPGVWLAIERCLDALLALPSPQARRDLASDLGFLAAHYFDFCPRDLATLSVAQRARVSALYPAPLRDLLGPALVGSEAKLAEQRVCAALGRELER